MLELRPNCERCDIDLPAASRDARICSFECTFCATCAEQHLQGHCPNCGGELVRRPIRPAAKLLTQCGKSAHRLSYRRSSRQNAQARCLPLVQVRPR